MVTEKTYLGNCHNYIQMYREPQKYTWWHRKRTWATVTIAHSCTDWHTNTDIDGDTEIHTAYLRKQPTNPRHNCTHHFTERFQVNLGQPAARLILSLQSFYHQHSYDQAETLHICLFEVARPGSFDRFSFSATNSTCVGISIDNFIANFLLNVSVKELRKSVNI